MTVLIADDSALVRAKVRELLESVEGVDRVDESCDVETTMSRFSELVPDLLVLDLRMPGGGGLEVLKLLSAAEDSRTTVAVFTNYPYPQLRKKCIELGARFFLDKSADFAVLREICEKWAVPAPQKDQSFTHEEELS